MIESAIWIHLGGISPVCFPGELHPLIHPSLSGQSIHSDSGPLRPGDRGGAGEGDSRDYGGKLRKQIWKNLGEPPGDSCTTSYNSVLYHLYTYLYYIYIYIL